jgi:hypothetical protein
MMFRCALCVTFDQSELIVRRIMGKPLPSLKFIKQVVYVLNPVHNGALPLYTEQS